jgi:hypothetical protein
LLERAQRTPKQVRQQAVYSGIARLLKGKVIFFEAPRARSDP